MTRRAAAATAAAALLATLTAGAALATAEPCTARPIVTLAPIVGAYAAPLLDCTDTAQ